MSLSADLSPYPIYPSLPLELPKLFRAFVDFMKNLKSRVGKETVPGHLRVIKNEIERINERRRVERSLAGGGELELNSSIWLRTCQPEVIQPLRGSQRGSFPKWLRGSLYRNGPGCTKVGNSEFKHLFDCHGVIHRFSIKNGQATYQCRYLKSKALEKNRRAERIVVSEFGTAASPDPCHSIFDRFSSHFDETDNAMISLYPIKDELYAFGETPYIHRIDLETIDTIKRVNFKKNFNIVHHTSHPHIDKDGSLFNLGLLVSASGIKYSIVHLDSKSGNSTREVFSTARVVAQITPRWQFHPSYMHTFGMTANYFVLIEQPLTVSVAKMLRVKLRREPVSGALKWFDDHPTLIHVINRLSGSVFKTFRAEPFFFLHTINQYEVGNNLVLDVCAYKDPQMIDCMYIESLKKANSNPEFANLFRGRPVRFILPLDKPDGHFVLPEFLCALGCETPRIHYDKYSGEEYRYFYAISSDPDLDNPGTLIKVDVRNKTHKTWTQPGTYPCEPIFVPSPTQKCEDDGVILTSILYAENPHRVAIVVLDALSFQELGRTEFISPTEVPKCLHGWYIQSREEQDKIGS